MKIKYLIIIAFFSLAISCKEKDPEETNEVENPYGTGIVYDEEMASLSTIPFDLSIVTLEDIGGNTNQSYFSLENWVPPVRSQGAYGTCTAWGVGYNARTIMYAREKNLSKADLLNDKNVFSPKDLFLALRKKFGGNTCDGAFPGNAFEIMQTRGIATLATAPYTDLQFCTQGTSSSADAEAPKYKIEAYRKVDPADLNALKKYLSMGRPLQISCKLGHNFFTIKNSDVFYTDKYPATEAEQKTMRHGYHSMCLVGYNDNKGTNGAFRIVNSWGPNWGDGGYAWIDYNFFCKTFCYSAYVIEGDKGGLSENIVNNEVIDPNFQVDGKDLISVRFKDEVRAGRDRTITYNVFNKGKETIPASLDWNIIYYYYNAYNPQNDYGVIVYDYYTDDVGSQYIGLNGDFSSVSTSMRRYGIYNWWNYADVKPGYSVAKAVAGNTGYDYDFQYDYQMPNITGDYYLVLMADGFDKVSEQYEQNNFIFLTAADRKPLKIVNGVIQSTIAKSLYDETSNFSEMKKDVPNAYTTKEIGQLIKYQLRTGDIEKNAALLKASSSQNASKKLVRAILPRTM